MRDGDPLRIRLPGQLRNVLATLADAGQEAALVGGCVRDLLRSEAPVDWDVATSAPPEAVAELFPGSTWENPFGTVTVRDPTGGPGIEVTTYRVEGGYRDRRRPDHVEWGGSLADDLARRDFTINAAAWLPDDLATGDGRLVDPFGGAADLEEHLLRAVGEAGLRFEEDALRLVRAVRFATRFELRLEPATEAAIREHAPGAATLSGERLRDELLRILAAPQPPSSAFLLMERLGLLGVVLPELAALRGVPQAKLIDGDALDHSLRTADALGQDDPQLRLAGLLHDLGKATTLADGHFIGHEEAGAEFAEQVLGRLRAPRVEIRRTTRLIRAHMFAYASSWSDAAVRRFVRRVGIDLLDELLALREADNAASGTAEQERPALEELRARAASVIAAGPLDAGQLAIDGNDLMAELDLSPGPEIGQLLTRLLDAAIEDPSLNQRERLLELAKGWRSS